MTGSVQPPVEIESLEVGPFSSNCHLLCPAGSARVLLIDPGDDADRILALLNRRGWSVERYLLTHGHMDHVSALAELINAHPAPVALHPLDAAWAFTAANTMPPYYPDPPRAAPIERHWADGQQWTDLGLTYEVWHTPGHSRGSVSLIFREAGLLFSGDVLFAGAIGRPDLPDGDARTLATSLKRLLTLPDEMRVYPGHGGPTTIGRERKHNPSLRDFGWAG